MYTWQPASRHHAQGAVARPSAPSCGFRSLTSTPAIDLHVHARIPSCALRLLYVGTMSTIGRAMDVGLHHSIDYMCDQWVGEEGQLLKRKQRSQRTMLVHISCSHMYVISIALPNLSFSTLATILVHNRCTTNSNKQRAIYRFG